MSPSQGLRVSPTLRASPTLRVESFNMSEKVLPSLSVRQSLFLIYCIVVNYTQNQSLYIVRVTLWIFLMKKVEGDLLLQNRVFFSFYRILEQFKENHWKQIEKKPLLLVIPPIKKRATTAEPGLTKKGNGTEEIFWRRSISNIHI